MAFQNWFRINKLIIIAITGISLFPGLIRAQVNTEKMRMGLDESGFAGNIKASYSVVDGNSELTKIEASPNLIGRSGRHQVFMLNDLARVYSDDGTIISKAFSHLRYNYEFSPVYIYEFFLQAQYNRSQDLDHRYLAGTGIRIVPYNSKTFLAAIGITGMYEDELLLSGKSITTPRGSSYLYLKWSVEDKLTLENTIYAQPAFDDFEDYRILNESQATAEIFRNLALTVELDYNYDSEPPEDIKRYDLELKNGIQFSF